jgi:quercetin dioxygenase-like cupin family protein
MYTVHESSREPGEGAPPHAHNENEEAFYVLDGVIEFAVDGERIRADSGTFVLVPRGTTHAFEVVGSSAARYLCIVSPTLERAPGRRTQS